VNTAAQMLSRKVAFHKIKEAPLDGQAVVVVAFEICINKMIAGKDPTDKMVKYDSSIGEASPETMSKEEPETPRPGELSSISEIQCYLRKYSTTSSVFAEQSISNPDYQKTLYW